MGNIKKLKDIQLKYININDNFWNKYMNLVKNVVIPYQWEALNDRVEGAEQSHCIKNYRIAAGEEKGEHKGYVFQDSDLSKWIEAASYLLLYYPDKDLENKIDEVIDLIGRAQQPDGYLNTFFTIMEPENRWINERDKHELYCAGHLIEAAVAYYEATGKQKLLNIACRFADYIDTVFGKEEGKKHGYPGHQEIELALVRLYHVTGDQKYLKLSKYFIDERGQEPNYFILEAENRIKKFGKEIVSQEPYNKLIENGFEYMQAHLPVREQKKVVGHAVRAMYLYTAMASLAGETEDETLLNACKILWDNATQCQMYITGGIGSDEFGEAFSFDYDLPNDRAYAETCASVGLIFWAQKMLSIDPDSKYADVLERALYNGTISGMSLDGKRFFYVNPLEVWPEACKKRHDTMHVAPVRQKWFGCACCPPNLARLIASVGKYIYLQSDDCLYVNLYIGNSTKFNIKGNDIKLIQESNYPWDGNISISVAADKPADFTIALRIPDWCTNANIKVNGETIDLGSILKKGYATIKRIWNSEDKIEIMFDMPILKIQANPNVRQNSGKVAIQRGPIVYCLEEVDNGSNLQSIYLKKETNLDSHFDSSILGGVTVIKGDAVKDIKNWEGKLYRRVEYNPETIEIKLVPYYAWGNREPGEMIIWIREC